jgi:membrane protease YdiL (CAAX protease family)
VTRSLPFPLPLLLGFVTALFTYDALRAIDGPVIVGSLVFFAAVLYRRSWAMAPCALLFFFMYVASRYYPQWVWHVPIAGFLVPLTLTALCCLPSSRLRARFNWLRKGNLDQVTWFLVVITSLVSALALILWALWTDYLGVATQMMAPLRETPRWFSYMVIVPGFALANAAAEELVYRGILQDALEQCFPTRAWLVLALQASAFAAAHFQAGFPNGLMGYAMTFVYALMLGFLRQRTRGMLAPWAAHVAADAVIGISLVLLAG